MGREERAAVLACETMWTYQQVLWFFEQYPNMTDEEAQLCLEVAQQLHAPAMLETLARAVGIYVKLEGEGVHVPGSRGVGLA